MKHIIPSLLFILIFFCGTTAKADPPSIKKVDSLKSLFTHSKNPIDRIDILNQLSRIERDRGDYKIALNYSKIAITLSTEVNYNKGKTDALLNLGSSERELGNYDLSLAHFNELIKISNKTRNIIAKGDAYDNIGHIFIAKNNNEQALKSHFLALILRKEGKDLEGFGNSCDNIAAIYYAQNKYPSAAIYYKYSLSIFEKLKDDFRVAVCAANLGMQYSNINNPSEALKYYDKALKNYEKLDNKEGIQWMCQLMGEIYSKTENHQKALEYLQKSLEISKKINKYDHIANGYLYLGRYYLNHEKLDLALNYFNKYLELGTKNKDLSIISLANYSIAKVYSKQNSIEESLRHLEIAKNIAVKISNKSVEGASTGLMGQIYLQIGNYKIAKEYTEKSLAYHQLTGEKSHLARDYNNLSLINEKMNDQKSALENYKLFTIYQDSIKQDDISKTVMKYEFDKKESDIKNKQKEEIRNKSHISNTIYGILGAVILSAFFILYTLRLRNKKLSAEKQNLELKRREAELAKETEAFKSRFLSNISHEFRTPLTLINGHLEILKKEGEPKDKKRFDEMEHSGQRLLQIINQLLDLTKLENNKYQLYYKKGNLLNEAQNYIQAFRSLAEQRNINLTTEITNSAELKFSKKDFAYSSETLATVFNNLISNAIKFTPTGGSVHCKLDFQENKLHFSVSDTGPGIPEKDLPNIFDQFYQVKTEEKPIYEGSGIGLAIVKELTLLHGGEVRVENNKNGGCTFSVQLSEGEMLFDSENATVQIPSEIPFEQIILEENKDEEEKPLILVVEDQPELRKFVVENLGSNYRFLQAENGKRGTELALEYLPDLVISDVMMSEMNGLQLCQLLKENTITSHIPIILLTGKSHQSNKLEGLESGADDYLTKPFSISELSLRVKNRLLQQENLRKKFVGNTLPIAEDIPELNQRDRNFLEKLDKIVHQNIEKDLGVTDLALEIGLSPSQLTRKLKTLIGQTPANFIKNIQMDIALQMLKNGQSVSEVAWSIGFSEPAYFSKIFKKHFGYLPSKNREHS